MHNLTEYLAYSLPGKCLAKALRVTIYNNCRVHLIQQAMSELGCNSIAAFTILNQINKEVK